MEYILIILAAYFLGSSSMAYYLSKLNNVNIQREGSGNLGASNTVVLLGWRAGVLVGLHDIGKGILAVLLAKWLFPDDIYAGALAGVACVIGHMFPFYLNFKGGKGFASYLGMTLALDWRFALVVMVLVAVVTVLTDYIVSGTMLTILVVPVYMGFITGNLILAAILGTASAVMVCKHKENFIRMRNGTETGLRSAMRGEKRIKDNV